MKRNLLLTMTLALLSLGMAKAQFLCQAGFVYYNSPGSTVVNFYDSSAVSTGTITSYTWNFGDNSTGTGANPTHVYNSIGIYGVSLSITTSGGCNSTIWDTVFVGTVACNLSATMNYSQLVQTLTASPVGGTPPYAYMWSTGSTGQSIQAFTPGTYCVTITDANACMYQSCYTVSSSSNCQAAFTYNNSLGSTLVNFSSTSTFSSGTITSYAWNFGDGSNGTGANPSHTYNSVGTFGVSLAISTSTGCTSTIWDTVWVGTQPCNLWASANYNSGTSELNVTAFGGNPPFSYTWFPAGGLSNPFIQNPTVSVSTVTTYCVIVSDSAGCSNQACVTVYPAFADTICGTVFNDVNGNGVQDSTEYSAYGYLNIYGSGGQFSAYVDSTTGHYSVGVPPGVYTIWFCSFGQLVNFTIPGADTTNCAIYDSVVVSGGGTHCGYNFGLQYNQAFIEGNIFVDSNNNGQMDSGESGISYQSIHIGNYWGYTDYYGHYRIAVAPNTYTVSFTPSGIYAGYTLSTPSSYSVTVANGATSSNNNFGIYMVPGSTNLSVSIIPHTTVTPGFPAWYDVYVNNIGANATAATLTFTYDPSLSFTNATPTQSSINTSTQTITWNIPTILPGNSRSFYARFMASTALSIGASTFEFVNVSANSGIDINLSNNFDSVHQIVTGSWDPNNKLVVSSNYSNPTYQVISSVNPNQSIDYTINFQNTGNAPAVNISVLDDLSADLDANSFTLLGTSHNANVSRNGNHLSFVFPNIMLADSNHNEPASHGFVNFRVNANPGLLPGHTILDKADIYFDFNAAVPTNNADLLLINPLSVSELEAHANTYVSPNPAKDVFNLHFTLSRLSDVVCSIKTIQGKLLETHVLKNQNAGNNSVRFDAAHLADGIYMVELNNGSQLKTIKLVKTK